MYDDRIQTLQEISEKYIKDAPNFSTLSKYLNEFIDYLFNLSHEKLAAEDESISYECVHMIHDILKMDTNLDKINFKFMFASLIKHFETQDISLLNEVIQVFKTIKTVLGEVKYSHFLHSYMDKPENVHIREVIDIYSIIFDGMVRLPKDFDLQK